VAVGVIVGGRGVAVAVGVGVVVGVGGVVAVGVEVLVGTGVLVGVAVFAGVGSGVLVDVEVAVLVGVSVGSAVLVGAGVGELASRGSALQANCMPASASRTRSTISLAARGRRTRSSGVVFRIASASFLGCFTMVTQRAQTAEGQIGLCYLTTRLYAILSIVALRRS
jgi:hypothetical protein